MPTIVLINPNSSQESTAAMVNLLAQELISRGSSFAVLGVTAGKAAAMLTAPKQLPRAAAEVARAGQRVAAEVPGAVGFIVGAFSDPGVAELAGRVQAPVLGLAAPAIRAAGRGGRRFGIATVAPSLSPVMLASVAESGLESAFTGIRFAEGALPGAAATTSVATAALMKDPAALEAALREAVAACVAVDGAEAVIIGGGPLARVAATLGGAAAPAGAVAPEKPPGLAGVEIISPLAASLAELLAALA